MTMDFTSLFGGSGEAGALASGAIAARLALALVAGGIVAFVYRTARQQERARLAEFITTLVLLTVLVAWTAIVIGSSVARAFGLVGALSIVRFRTIVEDTRDTAFVIFAVVAGMAAGAGEVMVCAIGTPIVAVVAYALARTLENSGGRRIASSHRLVVRVALGVDPDALLEASLERHARTHALVAIATSKQGTAIEARYDVDLRDPNDAGAVLVDLMKLDGIQHVEIEPHP